VKLNVEGFDGFESGSESEEEGEEQTSEVELKYYAQQKGMVQRVMSNYVDQIVSNLEDRFVESDQLSKFNIFVPSCIVRDSSVVRRHYILLLEPSNVRAQYIRKTADLLLQLWVSTFPRFVAIGFYFLSETLI
jgi:hypothetical protein